MGQQLRGPGAALSESAYALVDGGWRACRVDPPTAARLVPGDAAVLGILLDGAGALEGDVDTLVCTAPLPLVSTLRAQDALGELSRGRAQLFLGWSRVGATIDDHWAHLDSPQPAPPKGRFHVLPQWRDTRRR